MTSGKYEGETGVVVRVVEDGILVVSDLSITVGDCWV